MAIIKYYNLGYTFIAYFQFFAMVCSCALYFRAEVRSLLPRLRSLQGNSRRGRSGFASDFSVQSPEETRQELLAVHKLTKLANAKQHLHERAKRQGNC